MAEKFAYLIKLAAEENNNRYYRMIAQPDGQVFRIEMGRIGARPVIMKRPMSLWDVTLKRKLREGYVDRTAACKVEIHTESAYAAIQDEAVNKLFQDLLAYADQLIKDSYTVSYEEVSMEMLHEAQEILHEIQEDKRVEAVNLALQELFITIPRKMRDVKEMLIQNTADIPAVIQREQDILDTLKAKIAYSSKKDAFSAHKPTFLEAHMLEARECTDTENKQILKHLGSESAPLFVRAFRIKNQKTDERFHRYLEENSLDKTNIHFLYHGSPNANYIGLITQGQKLNPKAPRVGKMFGHGLYYAPRAKKSIGYTSICDRWRCKGLSDTGYLAVYKVAFKKPLDVYSYKHLYQSMDLKSIKPYDALFAHGNGGNGFLYNDEIIVYQEEQATLQYLIEIKR